MALADYAYYSGTYCGKAVDAGDFPRLIIKAGAVVDYLTFKRSKGTLTDDEATAVKMAECTLVDLIQYNESNDNRVIASESIGDKSVSYADTDTSPSKMRKYAEDVRVYLEPNDLMYRGLIK